FYPPPPSVTYTLSLHDALPISKALVTRVVFDQSRFVKNAIQTLLREGGIGLFLTSLMILIFLGSMRATVAVCLSIPLSALAAFIDRKSTRLNSSHVSISYAVFC